MDNTTVNGIVLNDSISNCLLKLQIIEQHLLQNCWMIVSAFFLNTVVISMTIQKHFWMF